MHLILNTGFKAIVRYIKSKWFLIQRIVIYSWSNNMQTFDTKQLI
jgi:hypothetical protein